MVSSNVQEGASLSELGSTTVDHLPSLLNLKLVVLDDVRFGVTNVPEDAVVHEQTTFVGTRLLLAMRAHGDQRLKLTELLHLVLFFNNIIYKDYVNLAN